MKPPPTVAEIGAEYVRQIVDLSPGQRKRYLAQVRTVCVVEVKTASGARVYRPFDPTVAQVKEADVKAWLIGWDRSLKTKANYHGLLYGVFGYTVEHGYLAANPCARTAPKRSRIRQSQADLARSLEDELVALLRDEFGELGLWVSRQFLRRTLLNYRAVVELVAHMAEAIDRFRVGEVNAFDVDHVLFLYSRAARDRWKFCNMADVETTAHLLQDPPSIDWWKGGAPKDR